MGHPDYLGEILVGEVPAPMETPRLSACRENTCIPSLCPRDTNPHPKTVSE